MKVVYNNVLPLKGFIAINLFGVLFVRKKYEGHLSSRTLNHEAIHSAQMRELLYIFFYIIYSLEWIYRLLFHTKSAYRGISFEQEAFSNENRPGYLQNRKHYAQWKRNR